ncbi:SIMPL domain-containing protein [Nibribacter koreensis]|uniref:SIMPL domain-containing protein n=1 Tax=Nibribacter koreensis TaxID=1084519 RepID=A0ABP8F5H3_9BACT
MERTLKITGKGTLAVAPDILILSFEAEAHKWDYEKTINSLNKKVDTLRALLEAEGIPRTNLKTKDFRVRKETIYNKATSVYDFNGYGATHSLEVELPLEKVLINKVLSQLASNLQDLDFNIAFGVKDASAHQQQLIQLGIAKAKENATLIATTTGVELQEILEIDYSFRELVIRSQRYDNVLYESSMAMETSPSYVDFEADDIKVSETITITWRIG